MRWPAAPQPAHAQLPVRLPVLAAPEPVAAEPTVSGATMAKAVLSLLAILAAAAHLLA